MHEYTKQGLLHVLSRIITFIVIGPLFVLYASEHIKRGILFILLIIIPVPRVKFFVTDRDEALILPQLQKFNYSGLKSYGMYTNSNIQKHE